MINILNSYLSNTRITRESNFRITLCVLLLGMTMTVATPSLSAVTTKAYQEFVRALNIIQQTQLPIFAETTPPNKNEIIAEYNALIETAEAELDESSSDFTALLEKKRIEIMRKLIFEALEQYDDKYANYIYPEALKKYTSRRNGNFVGVGLKFRAVKDDYPIAIGPLSGGPMDGVNIKPGDRLISVDGVTLNKLTSKEIVSALKGPADSKATIEVQRNDSKHSIEVTRAAVELHYAAAEMLDNNIGYIKVSRFGSKTHERVGELLANLLDQGAMSFILDLRDNPGGSTRAARAIVSMFSKEQHIYFEKYKSNAVKQLPRHGDHVTDLPLAVLINGESMSSSEIVAGAIKTYERGIVIGTQSYGKGLIQKVFKLAPPLGGAVRTTIAVFGTPDDTPIHATGIAPNILVESDSDFMFRRTGSLNISADARAFQRLMLEKDIRENKPERAEEYIAAKDVQLQTAIDKLGPLMNLQ